MKITAVVLTKNEARRLKKCLEGLSFCDEVIVVDDDSKDKTRQIAKQAGAKVYQHSLKDNYAQQRNFGLKKAKNEWVLFVDADEKVSPVLKTEILNFQFSIFNGVYLKRKDWFLGRWLNHGETGRVKLLRLGRKNAGRWQRKVHEFWQIEKGRVGELKSPLLHFPHSTLTDFLDKINEYTSLHAEELIKEGRKFQFWQVILYPTAKFLVNYFWRLGFLDGFPGLVSAWMMSFHSLVTRIKIWEKEDEII